MYLANAIAVMMRSSNRPQNSQGRYQGPIAHSNIMGPLHMFWCNFTIQTSHF